MKRIFISDLHLDEPESAVFKAFLNMLNHESLLNDEIYILGDLVEMWVGDDDSSDCALALIDALKRASAKAHIFIQHGNRDFLFGDNFCQKTGVQLLADPHLLDNRILLSHGDAFCTDDQPYQETRKMLRSAEWQQQILHKSLSERQDMGVAMRLQSIQGNANKSAQIMDVNSDALITTMQAMDAEILIHGHTHRPGDYLKRGSDRFRRIVLGDWQDSGWLCRQEDDTLQLECFGLTYYVAPARKTN